MIIHGITDYDIQALIDNELGWEDEKLVWSCIEDDRLVKAKYQEMIEQKRLLKSWWKLVQN